ncbi:MAG: hypothetical protein SGARI_006885, partial [Bacillariaceae sp.]
MMFSKNLLLFVSAFLLGAEAYVSQSVLPSNIQLDYLKQSTRKIIDSPPGELTASNIADSKHVLKGWAQLSKTAESVRTNMRKDKRNKKKMVLKPSKENAVAVENLLKRLVDEAKEGNTNANPTTVDYNCMLESWARSGEGEFAAER